jgi:hypothetical protein
MKGKLVKLYGSWFIQYDILGALPLHSNFVTMTDYVWISGVAVYDGDEVEFTEVLVNPMGREVDPNNSGQNHSKCIWHARPYLVEKEDLMMEVPMAQYPKEEIKIEDIFNDEKREGAKRVIRQHKVLKGLSLINPIHLFRVSDGHGEFPDGYKLTEKGIQYIIEQLNKE